MTPEARVKNMVRKVLDEFKFETTTVMDPHIGVPLLYSFWPVQNGMGTPSLDCLVCYYGHWIGIETKAPGKKPTPRQELTIEAMVAAGGVVLVIDGEEGCERLRSALTMIRILHANDRKPEA